MTERIDYAQSSDSATHDRKDFNDQIIDLWRMFPVDDVDRLNLGHEHDSFKGVVRNLDNSRP
jgi:hypothetical protein